MGLLKDFKEFAMRGNVVDMAVGVVVGAAFSKITSTGSPHGRGGFFQPVY